MFYELVDVIAFFDVKGLKKFIEINGFGIFNNAHGKRNVGAWAASKKSRYAPIPPERRVFPPLSGQERGFEHS